MIAPGIAAALDASADLTPFGVELRYPGDYPELLPGQEWDVFKLAQQTRSVIAALLPQAKGV